MGMATALFALAASAIVAIWAWLGAAVEMPPSPLAAGEKLYCVSYAPFRGSQNPFGPDAVSGGFEALVLRRAASGTASWIAWSAIAFAVGWSLLLAGTRMWEIGSDLPGQLANEALSVVTTVIMTLLMLPALRRLKSPTLSRAAQHFT